MGTARGHWPQCKQVEDAHVRCLVNSLVAFGGYTDHVGELSLGFCGRDNVGLI